MKMITLNMVDRRAPYAENEDGVAVQASQPVVIQAEAIRCFYTRHEGRPGTRITFTDGGGFAVIETFEQVKAALAAVGFEIPDAIVTPVLAIAAPVGAASAGLRLVDNEAEGEVQDHEATQH